MQREQSPARVGDRVPFPSTPRKLHRVERDELQTPCMRAKVLPVVSDVSTACPSSGFQELDLGFGAADQHSGSGSVHEALFDLNNSPMPSDFEAFKKIFGSNPADKTITDYAGPSMSHGEAPGTDIMRPSLATPDAGPRTLRGVATWASDVEVPSVPHSHSAPCLLKALQQKNLDALMAVLTEDPDSATIPFMEHNMEPPVCAAVRLRCPAAMVAALLECGADPEADDMWCNTATQHLQQQKRLRASSAEYVTEVEELLLRKGARHDCNSEPSVGELILQSTWAQCPSNVPCGIHGAPRLHCEWHLQWTYEQVEDLVHLESSLRSWPVGSKHTASVISSI